MTNSWLVAAAAILLAAQGKTRTAGEMTSFPSLYALNEGRATSCRPAFLCGCVHGVTSAVPARAVAPRTCSKTLLRP